MRRGADDDGVGFGQPLNPGGDIRRLAQREQLAFFLAADFPHHDQASVNADADLEKWCCREVYRGATPTCPPSPTL